MTKQHSDLVKQCKIIFHGCSTIHYNAKGSILFGYLKILYNFIFNTQSVHKVGMLIINKHHINIAPQQHVIFQPSYFVIYIN